MNERAPYSPPPKKTAPAYLMGVLLIVAVILLVAVAIRYNNREVSLEKKPEVIITVFDPFKEVRPEMRKANKLYAEAAALKNNDERASDYAKKTDEAIEAFDDLLTKLADKLDKYRDPETDILPENLRGYEDDISKIQTKLYDLAKTGGLGF